MPTEQTVLRAVTETVFTQEEIDAYRKEYASQASPEQLTLWLADCKRRGLIPQKDVVLQIRAVKEWDSEINAKVLKKKAIYITTAAALRKLAERTGKYAGQLPSKWVYLDEKSMPTIESDVPLPDPNNPKLPRTPWAAKAFILREGFKQPITAVARFDAYAQTYNDNGTARLNQTWATRGPEQLEKCAECGGLRKAFPDELAGLYLAEEIRDEVDVHAASPEPVQKPDEISSEAPKKRGRKKAEAASNAPSLPQEPVVSKSTSFAFGANATPTEEQTSAQSLPAPSSFQATDDDVPTNISDKPTKEERAVIANRLKAFKLDMQELGTWIKVTTGKQTTQDITNAEWSEIFRRLDSAVDEADLKAIVAGGK